MTPATSNSERLQNYLAGRLSETEHGAFEEQLLTDASLVRDVEESLRLREGLEILREQNVLRDLKRPRRTAFARYALASAAAAAAVFLAVGLYYVKHSDPIVAVSVAALRTNSRSPLVVAQTHVFAALRHETSSPPKLDLPANGALELRALTPITDANQAFRVTLLQNRGQTVSQIGLAEHVMPDTEGFVVIYADAAKLEPGDYSLNVEPELESTLPRERFVFSLYRSTRSTSKDD